MLFLLSFFLPCHSSSAGKESTCNAGKPNSIPGLGRSSGEGIGYPFQYSWAFLVAQMVKKKKKKFTCNVGDLASIPVLGRSPGGRIGYPLQYSWASLEAQVIKNLPEMQETWVWSLVWDDPLEEGMATHSSILPRESPWTEKLSGIQSTGF